LVVIEPILDTKPDGLLAAPLGSCCHPAPDGPSPSPVLPLPESAPRLLEPISNFLRLDYAQMRLESGYEDSAKVPDSNDTEGKGSYTNGDAR
jgi:hypothetical protein